MPQALSRYRTDPEFREKRKANSKRWAAANREYRQEYRRLRQLAHPELVRAQRNAWSARNPEKVRLANAKQDGLAFFGQYATFSQADYDSMLLAQGSCCAICGRQQSEIKRRLAVDHDHSTGKVRGLLCDRCNLTLGRVKDSVQILQNMIVYLTNSKL